jgi:sec-independent protein translocase protein TatC
MTSTPDLDTLSPHEPAVATVPQSSREHAPEAGRDVVTQARDEMPEAGEGGDGGGGDIVIEDRDEIPDDDLEMSLFDHLEELRQRIFYALGFVVLGIVACFWKANAIVLILEKPAQGVKFVQLSPGEYFFVSLKVAGYSGLILASPVILYQVIQFVIPGLTRRERRFLAPIVLGSGILFFAGLAFAYVALIPAALNFFITYGADVVEQQWSIERYAELVLLLLFSTGLAFQVPVVQMLLGLLRIVTAKQMLSAWRYVVVIAAIAGAILTPSTDPLTQSLLAGAVTALYLGGAGMVALLVRA